MSLLLLTATLFSAAPVAPAPERWREPVTNLELVWIAPGSFTMGSAPGAAGRQADETAHRVTLSRGFWLGRTEVTQRAWRAVMGENPSRYGDCARCPVENVSAVEVATFLDRLTARSPGSRFRLPTEAEWEYACRAGDGRAYPNGEALTPAAANYDDRDAKTGRPAGAYRGHPMPVASFPASPWGLFDLAGNVWEWTADTYGPFPSGPVTDPSGSSAGELRVIRGGSWLYGADSARCALRYTHRPADRGPSLGFRLVRDESKGDP
jgi:formylglycine-generating enzyme required for sulfatase activity